MKNYYNILNISKNASNDNIKQKTKELIKNIKSSNISSNDKKIKLKELEEAYTFLSDYHKRRSLDDYLENESNNNNFNHLIDPFSMFGSIFNNNNFTNNDIFNNSNKKTFYQSSSYSSTFNKDGNLITEEKTFINNNGDKKESHRIITKDENGNETVKEIPIKNKKKIKYDI
jgi:DnaJ-class molecular chaperone